MLMAGIDAEPVAREESDWGTIALMALGFGLVGIDRFMISTLFPIIAKELSLDYAAIGVITGALAFAWGAAALVMGNRADRLGRRTVLVGALLAFAILIGASGLAAGLVSLIAVRIVMGLADGAYTPASIAVTLEAAAPRHRGLAIGIQQMMLPVFGLGIAPLIIAELLHVVDWRWTFLMFAGPGFLLAYLVWKRLPARKVTLEPAFDQDRSSQGSLSDWRTVLGFHNVRLAMAMMLCWLTCLVTTSAFLPNYLIDHVGLPFSSMSRVMSAIGLGSAFGTIILAWASDRLGRKPVMILCSVGALIATLALNEAGSSPWLLFGLLFVIHFFNNAAITLTVGPICAETVPPRLMATSTGIVIATGELVGGGLAPVLAGTVASRFGIDHLLWLPAAALGLGVILSLALIETRVRTARVKASVV